MHRWKSYSHSIAVMLMCVVLMAGCRHQTQPTSQVPDFTSIIQQLQQKIQKCEEDFDAVDDYFWDYVYFGDYLALLTHYRDTHKLRWDKCEHALVMASVLDHTDVVKWLLSEGADANSKEERRYVTALMVANAETAKVLLAAGADVNAKEWYGLTALMLAKDPAIIKLLREAGAIEQCER